MPPLALTYAEQGINRSSAIDQGEQACSSAKGYGKTVEAVEAKKNLDVWELQEEYPFT